MSRLVVGIQPVREAVRAHGDAVERLCIDKRDTPRLEALARFALDRGIVVERMIRGRLEEVCSNAKHPGIKHQGAVAFAPALRIADLDALDITPDTLLLLLDKITDPQNFGAVLRSAVALGASGVVWGENHAAPLTPATFRASAGAVEHATLFRVRSLRGALTLLAERGVTTVALDAAADITLGSIDLRGPLGLVIGSEDEGVSRGVRRLCSARGRLPMSGRIDSLNASVAAALAVYEAIRQRG
jgi:23S rRNA (guanosine2251-2'-O)-methyltransferase